MKFLSVILMAFALFLPDSQAFAMGCQPKEKIAPEFPDEGVWLNSEPLSRKVFKGKATLVYFWDYTSVNCLRDQTYLHRWYERYHPYGFEMIWIHSPEFEFAKEKSNVLKALQRYKVSYPVFLDNDHFLWKAYKIFSWPTKILVDSKGEMGPSQMGEGAYLSTEDAIRQALQKFDARVILPAKVLDEEPRDFSEEACGPMSNETYMGYKRIHWWGGEIANQKWTKQNETTVFKDRGDRVQRGFFLHGLWTNHEDYFQHSRSTDKLTDYLGILYYGNRVYSVMSPSGSEAKDLVYVTRDDVPVPARLRGGDLQEDSEGRTYAALDEPRLYHLIQNEDDAQHEIKVWTQSKGVAISSFSFANHCLSQIDIL